MRTAISWGLRGAALVGTLVSLSLACSMGEADESSATRDALGELAGASIPRVGDFPLHTSGRRIVDKHGRRVKLAGVNWYGAEERDMVVAGLDKSSLADIAELIKAHGFNSVRLPWANEMLHTTRVVDERLLSKNEDLVARVKLAHGGVLPPREVFHEVVKALTDAELLVILDNHTTFADWCCAPDDGNEDWAVTAPRAAEPKLEFPPSEPGWTAGESAWIEDWTKMAIEYADNPRVVGADLRNEPRTDQTDAYRRDAGDAGLAFWLSWRRAAKLAGDAIAEKNPHMLIIVEGINYAADLRYAGHAGVELAAMDRLVYSAHDYPWFHVSGKSDAGQDEYESYGDDDSGVGLHPANGRRWGYLLRDHPVFVGEFGVNRSEIDGDAATSQGLWFEAFLTYLRDGDIDWAYFPLNGTMANGMQQWNDAKRTWHPRHAGATANDGLSTPDWKKLDARLLRKLAPLQRPLQAF